MSLSIEQFNPTAAELKTLVASSKELTISDFSNKEQIEAVKARCKELVSARTDVQDKGKLMRADALQFQRDVIALEKDLVAIIEPEELRLKRLLEEAKNYLIKQERLRKQPERLERLKATGEWEPVQGMEEAILELDDVDFQGLIDRLNAAHTQKEQAKKDAEQAAKQAELDARQAELDAKQAAIDAKENEQKRKEAQELAEKQRAADIEAAKAEGERKAKEDAAKAQEEEKARLARLEKTKKYKEFLEKHGYNEKTKDKFKVFETENGYTLYKLVGEFLK